MDTLSTSVSSLNLPSLPPPPAFNLRLGTTTASASATATKLPRPTSIIYHKPISFAHTSPNFPHHRVSFSYVKPSKPLQTQKNAASGYAAALVSVGQSRNCLWRIQEDVERLLEFLDDGFLVGEEKGEIVKEVVERGKFGKYLKGLVKILVERGRLGILGEVLEEFEGIYDELVGTKVVWVSS